MSRLNCHSERSEESLIDLFGQPTTRQPEMFESLASCFRISLQRFVQHDRRTVMHFFS
jgi:hypothetical protein